MSVKILLSYHKNSTRLKSDIFTPIHVGRVLASDNTKKELADIIGDDTGDNISDKNGSFCELTSTYWAWKNYDKLGNPDYIGFMHYRRHISFKEDFSQPDQWGTINSENLDFEYIKRLGLYDDCVKNTIGNYDIITTEKWDVTQGGYTSNYQQYETSSHHAIDDYNRAMEIIVKKYPEYTEAIKHYNNANFGYFTNIFIMKKDIFFHYCEWLFDILFEVEKFVDITNCSVQEKRVFGYIAERLTGIYLFHNANKYSIKELSRTFVSNTDYVPYENAINICFSVDNNYIKPLAATIASILANSARNDKHNFYILDDGISIDNKCLLASLQNIKPFYMEFISVNVSDFADCPMTVDAAHITLPTYFRFKISSYFSHLDKILYLDCDIIVLDSLIKLWNVNTDDYYFAGINDIYGSASMVRLNLLNCYINAGVMLINLKLWREEDVERKLFEYAKNNHDKILWQDQDVLNVVLQDKIKLLPDRWNYQYNVPYDRANSVHPEYFDKPLKNLGIIHFIGFDKPWRLESNAIHKEKYYEYLALTPWKEESYKKPPKVGLKARVKNLVLRLSRITRTERYVRKAWRLAKSFIHNDKHYNQLNVVNEQVNNLYRDLKLVIEQNNYLIQQSDLAIKQNYDIHEQNNHLIQQGDFVVKQNDSIREQNNHLTQLSDLTIKQNYDIHEQSNYLIQQSDLTIKQNYDIHEQSNHLIQQSDLAIKQNYDIHEQSNRLIQQSDLAIKQNYDIHEQNNHLIQRSDLAIKQNYDIHEQNNYLIQQGDLAIKQNYDIHAQNNYLIHKSSLVAGSDDDKYTDMNAGHEVATTNAAKIFPLRKRRKIQYLISSHDASRTGAPLIIYNIAKYLVNEHDISCVIITVRGGGGGLLKEFSELGPVYCYSDCNTDIESFIAEIMAKYHFDGIILNSYESHVFYEAILKYNIKTIALIHEFLFAYDNPKWCSERVSYLENTTVIYPAKIVKTAFEEYCNVLPKKSFIMPQGVFDPNFPSGDKQTARVNIRKKLGLPKDTFIVLGCGYVDQRKGCDFFVDMAIKMSYEKNIFFVWVGTFDLNHKFYESLKDRIDKLKLSNIKFAGSFKDISEWLLAVDCFTMVSRNDPFPMVVLESMAAELPVICFDEKTGSVDAVEHDAGFIVPYFDLQAVTDKVLYIYNEPNHAKQLGVAGKKKIKEQYNYDKYVNNIYGLLKKELNYTKKIYFLCISWEISGANTLMESYGLALQKLGWEVTLLFTRTKDELITSTSLAESKLPAIYLPFDNGSDPAGIWLKIRNFIENNSPCILIPAFDYVANSIVPVLSDNVVAVLWNHSDDMEYYEQAHRIGRYFNISINVSKLVHQKINDILPALKNTYIPNSSVTRDMLSTAPKVYGDKIKLIYTGRLEEYQKRVREFVPFVKALDEANVDYLLTLVGDGNETGWLREKFEKQIAEGKIILTGRLSFEEVIKELKENHFFLLLSDFEGMPLSLIEAMSQGCIPLTTNIKSGVPEIINTGENGYIMPDRNYDKWVELILEIYSDKEKFEKISTAALSTIQDNFTVESIVQQYDDILMTALNDIEQNKYKRPDVVKWQSDFGDILPPYSELELK